MLFEVSACKRGVVIQSLVVSMDKLTAPVFKTKAFTLFEKKQKAKTKSINEYFLLFIAVLYDEIIIN